MWPRLNRVRLTGLARNSFPSGWPSGVTSLCGSPWVVFTSPRRPSTTCARRVVPTQSRGGFKPQSTYVCRVQSTVWRRPKYLPPNPPLHPASVSSPRTKGGGTHSPGGEGGGNILEDAIHRIGLLQYNLSTVQAVERDFNGFRIKPKTTICMFADIQYCGGVASVMIMIKYFLKHSS
jgi:hypothetical protein